MTGSDSFQNQLLAADRLSAESRHQLELEMQNMLITRLTTTRRTFLTLLAVFDFAAAILCGSLVLTEPQLPWLARLGLGVGSLFGLAWGAWFVRLLWRGEFNAREDSRWMARMVWCFTLLMVIFMVALGMMTEDRLKGILAILQSLVFLIGAAVYWISHRIEDSELNLTERLLRMELQIAERGRQE